MEQQDYALRNLNHVLYEYLRHQFRQQQALFYDARSLLPSTCGEMDALHYRLKTLENFV